jgi:hypothetical protein
VLVAAGMMLAATACAGDDGTAADTTSVAVTDAEASTTAIAPAASRPTEGSTTSTPSDAGRIVRASDDGVILMLGIGETAVLIQADPFSPDPVVRGEAVDLVEIVSVAGTGDRRWEIRAVSTGVASLDVQDGETSFSVGVEVSG